MFVSGCETRTVSAKVVKKIKVYVCVEVRIRVSTF